MINIHAIDILDPDKRLELAIKVTDRHKNDPDLMELLRQMSVDCITSAARAKKYETLARSNEAMANDMRARLLKMHERGAVSDDDPDYFSTYEPITQFIALLRIEGGSQNHLVANLLDKIIRRAMTLERIVRSEMNGPSDKEGVGA